MEQNTNRLSLETVQGFFDADGSYEAKVYVGTQKSISFHVNIIFSQKHRDVLQTVINSTVINSIDTNSIPEDPGITISERTIENLSGTTSTANSISIAFSHPVGKKLLNFWLKKPPKAPTKLLDFRIAYILAEIKNLKASQVIRNYLPNNSIQNERIASLALLWLRYRMRGKENRHSRLRNIESYYSELNATEAEIQQSVAIGQQLYAPIKLEMDTLRSQVLSDDYLLGYHIGDGSFQMQTEFGPTSNSFQVKFTWTITDSKENLDLLKALENQLKSEGIHCAITDYDTYYKLHVSGVENCKKLVEKWQDKKLPSVRQNQYDCFRKALDLYSSPNFRQELAKLEDVIHLKWVMNPDTNYKKSGSEQEDLAKVRLYFNNKNNRD